MTVLEQKLIKKEKEAENLAEALKRAHNRLGVEIISDTDGNDTLSDSDSNTGVIVNTRYPQRDAEFANQYFFITNVRTNECSSHNYM